MEEIFMSNSPSLIINKLVLVGRRKNYTIPFHKGLNVIYGDSDTGKSSILNLVDYSLGSAKVDMYDEIEYSGKYCLMEVQLNGKTYTIKRDIFDSEDFIQVYPSSIEEMDSIFPYEYGPHYNKEGAAGFFSDFLLQSLNIPLVKVKRAPTQAVSEPVRVGFRDIFKFCNMNQDEVGSKFILDAKNGPVFTKNKETFKFIHNVLDSQITELQNDQSAKVKEKNKLENKLDIISSFLRETQLKPIDILANELNILDEQYNSIELEIKELNTNMSSNTKYNNELREIIQNKKLQLNEIDTNKEALEANLEQNIRLKKEYDKDITKLQSVIEVKTKMPISVSKEADCPVCHRQMKIEDLKQCLGQNNAVFLKEEIQALKRRKQNLISLIDKQFDDLSKLDRQREILIEELNKAEILLDSNTKTFISPYISQRDGLIAQRAATNEQKSKISYLLKLRKQLGLISKDIETTQKQIDDLIIKIDELKKNAPSTETIVSDLGDYLKNFLDYVRIKNPINIGINDKSFLPIVRGKNYLDLTSGGLRTITSVGYFVSLLRNSLANNTNLPKFLMIDTIGKYLGKTDEKSKADTNPKEDALEGISDPHKYLNMYKYLINLCETKDKTEEGIDFQILIVDNEIPVEIEKIVAQYVIKRFSTEHREGFDIGFIDDADSNSSIL
jgi:hypothetical protein